MGGFNENWFDVKYTVQRTAAHIFYLLLALLFFAAWYLIVIFFTRDVWDIRDWQPSTYQVYFLLSIPSAVGYWLIRVMT